ncbi:MAG: metallopeptidase family protein [Chloroflexi bacterium]|nr:metallopeptidase family protein [Chloroflexota bacterium]
MERSDFERLVAEAYDEMPDDIRAQLDNVEITVEDWPDPATMRQAGVGRVDQLLGFYHGIPRTQRTHHYTLALPDKITIYQAPIEARCRTTGELKSIVRRVLYHEFAHHFGISDERLREIGAY